MAGPLFFLLAFLLLPPVGALVVSALIARVNLWRVVLTHWRTSCRAGRDARFSVDILPPMKYGVNVQWQ